MDATAYLRRRQPIKILALLATRVAADPDRAAEARSDLMVWVRSVGRDVGGPALAGAA